MLPSGVYRMYGNLRLTKDYILIPSDERNQALAMSNNSTDAPKHCSDSPWLNPVR